MPVESPKFDASIRDLRQIRGVTGDLELTRTGKAAVSGAVPLAIVVPSVEVMRMILSSKIKVVTTMLLVAEAHSPLAAPA